MICSFCNKQAGDCCEEYEVFQGLPPALQQITLDDNRAKQTSRERDEALPAQPKTRGRHKLFKEI